MSEGSGRSDWRELSLSWVRAQPITVWPRLASSKARALPSPLPTPVISTVRELAPFTAFIPLYDVVLLLLFIHTQPLSLSLSLCFSISLYVKQNARNAEYFWKLQSFERRPIYIRVLEIVVWCGFIRNQDNSGTTRIHTRPGR